MGNAAQGGARRLHHPVRVLELRGQPGLYAKVPYDPVQGLHPAHGGRRHRQDADRHPIGAGEDRQGAGPVMKANPGKYNNYAHAGVGTTPHLSGELSGSPPASTSCMCRSPAPAPRPVDGRRPYADHVHDARAGMPHQGQAALACGHGGCALAALPDVPTMAEAGFPDQEANTFVAASAAGRHAEADRRPAYSEIIATLKRWTSARGSPRSASTWSARRPEEFAALIKADDREVEQGDRGRKIAPVDFRL